MNKLLGILFYPESDESPAGLRLWVAVLSWSGFMLAIAYLEGFTQAHF